MSELKREFIFLEVPNKKWTFLKKEKESRGTVERTQQSRRTYEDDLWTLSNLSFPMKWFLLRGGVEGGCGCNRIDLSRLCCHSDNWPLGSKRLSWFGKIGGEYKRPLCRRLHKKKCLKWAAKKKKKISRFECELNLISGFEFFTHFYFWHFSYKKDFRTSFLVWLFGLLPKVGYFPSEMKSCKKLIRNIEFGYLTAFWVSPCI